MACSIATSRPKILKVVQSPRTDASSESPASSDGSLRAAGGDPQTGAQIASLAELALLHDPLNARAFRILGQLSDQSSEHERTETLMQAAARRSLFESVAVYWLMRKSYQDQDYHSAIRYADTLLRTRPHEEQLAMPLLAKLVEIPAAHDELKQLLARSQSWRWKFFSSLPYSISDARTPLNVLLSLKETPAPPAAEELKPYLDFLISRGLYELAYYTWLQFLPAESLSKAGYLFNGSFELAPSGLPFDWVFTKGFGVTTEIRMRPDSNEGRALFVEFGYGRVADFSVTQLITLPPGSYKFRGKFKVDVDFISQRGLHWNITCAREPRTLIGESYLTTTRAGSAWNGFEFSFTVPTTDCPAQYVKLDLDARSPSEQFVSGSVWYDDLEIQPEPSALPGEANLATPHSD